MDERVKKLMEKLDLTYKEAVELLEADKEVDRMTKMSDINSDLTEEQKQAQKKNKNVARGVSDKPTAKREKKVDDVKKSLIQAMMKGMNTDVGIDNIEVLNDEREFTFNVNGEKYKVVLSKPRK